MAATCYSGAVQAQLLNMTCTCNPQHCVPGQGTKHALVATAAAALSNCALGCFQDRAAHIPKILGNANGHKGLKIGGDPAHTNWGVVFHDLNQLMAVTLRVTARGKISLHYMLNSYMPKVALAKATITLTCDKFADVADVRADYNKDKFPTDISTEFTKTSTEGQLVIHVEPMSTHHCANLKASWYLAVSAWRENMQSIQAG